MDPRVIAFVFGLSFGQREHFDVTAAGLALHSQPALTIQVDQPVGFEAGFEFSLKKKWGAVVTLEYLEGDTERLGPWNVSRDDRWRVHALARYQIKRGRR